MGLFTSFILDGFRKDQLKFYSPGTLYEVMSKLGESLKADEMRAKVNTLLDHWAVPADAFRQQGQKVPAYALELHAINEKSSSHNGYGTYVYVPEDFQTKTVVPLTSIFNEPMEIYDDEDPIKILSATYADGSGYSTDPNLTVYELSLTKEEFYPINIWGKEHANDPLEELFGIFDALKPGEYGGVSLIVVPPEEGWELGGRKRIRNIEDPEYQEQIGFIESVSRMIHDEKMPDEEVDRLAGYRKQQLDNAEKAEIDAIRNKISGNAFRCTLRVYGSSPKIADDLAGVIVQKSYGKYNSLKVFDTRSSLYDLAIRKEGKRPFHMSSAEIAGLWHVPAENTMGVKRHHPLPAALTPPDELLAINIGDPGDIQKLLYSMR